VDWSDQAVILILSVLFGAITPNTAPVTFTVTLTGGNGNCTSNDTTVLADEFSGNDITGGRTTFDAHSESLDPAAGGICTGALVTPANNNDAIWYACFDNVTGVGGGYVKGQDDTTGDWSEYRFFQVDRVLCKIPVSLPILIFLASDWVEFLLRLPLRSPI